MLKPIQIWFQRRGYIESDFTEEIIEKLCKMIQPGDVLLSYESGRWTSLFIKGEFTHAAIVNEEGCVVEAVGDDFRDGVNCGGVRKVSLRSWLWKKYHVAVFRHKNPNMAKFAARDSNLYLGRKYDYGFSFYGENLYCSELVYVCFKPYDIAFMDFVPKNKEILPIDYFREPSLTSIYNSKVQLNP